MISAPNYNLFNRQAFCGNTNAPVQTNNQLTMGPVVPPDKLPTADFYDTTNETSKENRKANKPAGGAKLTAGKVSALCAFGAILLSAISLLPFIRKH